MRVAVFGAAGFIGKNLIRALQERGMEFIAADIAESPFSRDVNYTQVDILNPNKVEEVVSWAGTDGVVVHLAASPLSASWEDMKTNMRVNIEGTLNIMEACRKHRIQKMIFSSASSIIGKVRYPKGRNYAVVDEEHPCTPMTPYAITKKACEDYLRIYHNKYNNFNYLIFRFFNVYGPEQRAGVVPSVYRTLKKGETFTIYGERDNPPIRDFIYVGDVVKFIINGIKREDVKNEVVNLGTGVPTTIEALVKISAEILNVEARIAYAPPKPGEIGNFIADLKKLKRLFGEKPKTNLENGLQKTFEWMEKFKNW